MEEAGEAGMDELGGGGHERSLEGEGRWPKRKATCRRVDDVQVLVRRQLNGDWPAQVFLLRRPKASPLTN